MAVYPATAVELHPNRCRCICRPLHARAQATGKDTYRAGRARTRATGHTCGRSQGRTRTLQQACARPAWTGVSVRGPTQASKLCTASTEVPLAPRTLRAATRPQHTCASATTPHARKAAPTHRKHVAVSVANFTHRPKAPGPSTPLRTHSGRAHVQAAML